MQLPFGEWLPDQPDHLNPGATVATNVYHAQSSYKPVKGLVAYSGASNVTQNAKGAGSFRDNTNTVFTFVGTKDNIYKLTSGTFSSVKGSLTISGGDTDFFTFTQFGNYVIASNGVNPPMYYLMGTSTNFATLQSIATAGTVPSKFRVSGVIRDFLVTGNIQNAKNRVAWSGINDISTWEAGVSSSDTQDLPGSGGQVVAITSGEVGYVFRQNQILRMDFVGGNVIFRFSVISPNRGAVYGQTVCQDNRQVFFYADDGFFQINGDQVLPIGAEKVNRFFDLDLNKAFSDRITAAVDPFNTLAIWLYPSKNNPGNTTGICDRLLIYNYVTQKWSIANVKASQIFEQFVTINTVELMDLISENLDDINISLDTPYWTSGQLYLGAIDENFKAAIFSGTALEAELETKETELFPGLRANITSVRPIVDATSNVVIKTRDKLADTVTSSASSTINQSGISPVRQSGRYFRANVKVPAGTVWTHAQGIDLTASQGGSR
nr:Phage stabilisation protein [uncultured Mediterranean phage uvMED]BAR31640.1 Phage stabilisation protein [uncultured Mediterranean phage uvMED]